MARKVFFSFHYERDIWCANVVRNSWVTQDREAAGFWDASLSEEVKSDEDIKRWINKQLEETSVTVVLIGAEASERKYVIYEIKQSCKKDNGLSGIYTHKLKDEDGKVDYKGKNPFDNPYIERNGRKVCLSEIHPTYDWVDDGYNNFGNWVEKQIRRQEGKA